MSAIPSRVDVTILGTGLTNSIIAAACSRVGKSVLHLDENTYYGKDWASFTFQQLVDWIHINYPGDPSLDNIPDELINKSRMFSIDLAPKFLYSNGEMVDLLVKSNVARYHEFKNNIRILCLIEDDIHVMPCRRNEVFTSALLESLADKRRLMKFIELCLKYEPENAAVAELSTSIKQYLEDRGFKPTLQEYVINSIAMVRPNDSTREACEKIKRFMIATERYGRSPFLFPVYGCGEFPQSFCRLSAVFGGLYCLNTKIGEVQTEQPSGEASESTSPAGYRVKLSDQDITVTSDMLVVDKLDAINLKLVKDEGTTHRYLSRAILITNRSIVVTSDHNTSQDMASFLRIPPGENSTNIVYLVEVNSSFLVSPKDKQIVYLWTQSTSNPKQDLESTVRRVFKNNSDCIEWQFFFRQPIQPECIVDEDRKQKSGLIVTNSMCDDIDYLSNIREAEKIFRSMYPDEEFLPRAPDPDEIISFN